MSDPDWDFEPVEPNRWRCEECRVVIIKPWPKDRAQWYMKPRAHKCPRCKSEALTPEGF